MCFHQTEYGQGFAVQYCTDTALGLFVNDVELEILLFSLMSNTKAIGEIQAGLNSKPSK